MFTIIVLCVLQLILSLWAVFDILKKKPQNALIWGCLCVFLPIAGSIIYFQWKYWSQHRYKCRINAPSGCNTP